MAELIPLWEIEQATFRGIGEAELRELFNVVTNWRGQDSITVQDAAKAYALGRPRMKEITMPSGGQQWVRVDG
jgi:uncharacterized protein YbaA (DUF1428 family)